MNPKEQRLKTTHELPYVKYKKSALYKQKYEAIFRVNGSVLTKL